MRERERKRSVERGVCTNEPFLEFLWCDDNVFANLARGMEQLKQRDKPPKTKRKF
jgi:hypothetical protein